MVLAFMQTVKGQKSFTGMSIEGIIYLYLSMRLSTILNGFTMQLHYFPSLMPIFFYNNNTFVDIFIIYLCFVCTFFLLFTFSIAPYLIKLSLCASKCTTMHQYLSCSQMPIDGRLPIFGSTAN